MLPSYCSPKEVYHSEWFHYLEKIGIDLQDDATGRRGDGGGGAL